MGLRLGGQGFLEAAEGIAPGEQQNLRRRADSNFVHVSKDGRITADAPEVQEVVERKVLDKLKVITSEVKELKEQAQERMDRTEKLEHGETKTKASSASENDSDKDDSTEEKSKEVLQASDNIGDSDSVKSSTEGVSTHESVQADKASEQVQKQAKPEGQQKARDPREKPEEPAEEANPQQKVVKEAKEARELEKAKEKREEEIAKQANRDKWVPRKQCVVCSGGAYDNLDFFKKGCDVVDDSEPCKTGKGKWAFGFGFVPLEKDSHTAINFKVDDNVKTGLGAVAHQIALLPANALKVWDLAAYIKKKGGWDDVSDIKGERLEPGVCREDEERWPW